MAVRRKRRKHSGSDLLLAPAVIGMRVPLLMLEAALRFWPDVLSGKSPSLCDGTVAMEAAAAALLPAARQVRRNFDRLSKRR
ncbi:MAG: hypothetical protein E5V99_17205 [Mesorhizobium sp.]|nr:MAG: hypothetical protein E5V99_17205 [Mesorhizobium sp.]